MQEHGVLQLQQMRIVVENKKETHVRDYIMIMIVIAALINLKFEGRLTAGHIVGHGDQAGDGMDHRQQEAVVKRFREGAINVLVATSVAEEGLDVQSCNTVVRYSSASTLTSFIQSRGRARAKGSKFVVFVDADSPGAGRAEIEDMMRREKEMNLAVRMLMRGRVNTKAGEVDIQDELDWLSQHGAREFMEEDAMAILLQYCSEHKCAAPE